MFDAETLNVAIAESGVSLLNGVITWQKANEKAHIYTKDISFQLDMLTMKRRALQIIYENISNYEETIVAKLINDSSKIAFELEKYDYKINK
jgi:hypothetical protein